MSHSQEKQLNFFSLLSNIQIGRCAGASCVSYLQELQAALVQPSAHKIAVSSSSVHNDPEQPQ